MDWCFCTNFTCFFTHQMPAQLNLFHPKILHICWVHHDATMKPFQATDGQMSGLRTRGFRVVCHGSSCLFMHRWIQPSEGLLLITTTPNNWKTLCSLHLNRVVLESSWTVVPVSNM
jgi:hypothetical protein